MAESERYIIFIWNNINNTSRSELLNEETKASVRQFLEATNKRAYIAYEGTEIKIAASVPVNLILCPWKNRTEVQWMQVCTSSDYNDVLDRLQVEECDPDLRVQQLHVLCDSLENKGVYIDVVWLPFGDADCTLKDNLGLYGALKRLVEWHGAHVNIVAEDKQMNEWCKVLRANYIQLEKEDGIQKPSRGTLYWRGSVKVTGTQVLNPTYLPGFELTVNSGTTSAEFSLVTPSSRISTEAFTETLPGYLSGELELLQIVQTKSVPSFMLTETTLNLCLLADLATDVKCQSFINMLNQEETCCIVRLKHGSQFKCSEKWNTVAWEEAVENDANVMSNTLIPFTVCGRITCHNFLVTCDKSSSNYTARLLYPPSGLNGKIAHTLAIQETHNPPSDADDMHISSIVDHLPYLGTDDFFDMCGKLKWVQMEILTKYKEWKLKREKTSDISLSEVQVLLHAVNAEFVATLKQLGNQKEHVVSNWPENSKPEYELQKSSCCELESLRIKEVLLKAEENMHRKKLLKERSNDSFSVLSPPPLDCGRSSQMDISDFLKHFKPDGSAVNKNMTPFVVQPQGSPLLSKFDSGDSRLAPWPECASYHYHGIHYHLGPKVEKMESFCSKLQANVKPLETMTSLAGKQVRKVNSSRRTSLESVAARKVSLDVCLPKMNKAKKISEHPSVEKEADKAEHVRQLSVKRRLTTEPIRDVKRVTRATVDVSQEKKQVVSRENNLETLANTDPKREPKERTRQRSSMEDTGKPNKRSERHKKMLENVIKEVLYEHGVKKREKFFKPVALRLYTLTKSFIKDLKSSRNLHDEMTKIATSYVQQIVQFETSRLDTHT